MNLKLILKNKKAILKNKKATLNLLIRVLVVSLVIFLVVFKLKEKIGFKAKAAPPFGAIFFLVPSSADFPSGINLLPGQQEQIDVSINAQMGESPAEINGIQFIINFDPNKIKLLHNNGGLPGAEITTSLLQNLVNLPTGHIFESGGSILISPDTRLENGQIRFEMAVYGDSAVPFSGTNGLVYSFFIEALGGAADADTLSFANTEDDGMSAHNRLDSDDALLVEMNGADTSSLVVNFGTPSVPTLFLTTTDSNPTVGDSFDVNIEVDTAGENIIGIDADLNYNSDVLEIINITSNTDMFAIYEGLTPPIPGGLVNFEVSGYSLEESVPPPPYNGSGTFATISFQALTTGDTDVTFTFDNTCFTNPSPPPGCTTDSNVLRYIAPRAPIAESQDILQAVSDLSINVGAAPSPSPSPSALPSPSPSALPSPSPSAYTCADYPADVDADRDVDSADVSIIVAGWGNRWRDLSPSACKRDLNGDGIVNVADIQILVSWWGYPWE